MDKSATQISELKISDSSRSSSCSNLNDLSELDNLIEDLALAKKQFQDLKVSLNSLSLTNSLSSASNNKHLSSNNDYFESLSSVNYRNTASIATTSSMQTQNKHLSYSTSSSSPPSISQSASQYSQSSPTNTNSTSSNQPKGVVNSIRAAESSSNDSINNQNEADSHASKAAKELDDLMTKLSNYKVNPLFSTFFFSFQIFIATTLKIKPNDDDTKKSTQSISRLSTGSNNRKSASDFLQPKASNNCCFSCREPICGQVITALGCLWHPNHFVCFYCNKSIGTNLFYEKDNRPYCEDDYLRLFSPKCASCSLPILDVREL